MSATQMYKIIWHSNKHRVDFAKLSTSNQVLKEYSTDFSIAL